jgi:hypothetical protein
MDGFGASADKPDPRQCLTFVANEAQYLLAACVVYLLYDGIKRGLTSLAVLR